MYFYSFFLNLFKKVIFLLYQVTWRGFHKGLLSEKKNTMQISEKNMIPFFETSNGQIFLHMDLLVFMGLCAHVLT